MTKLLVMPPQRENIQEILKDADAIILGISDYSVNFCEVSLSELEDIVKMAKKCSKEIFISLNKNMHNADLEPLAEILKKCSKWQVDGIFYYDVAVLQLSHKLSLDLRLIWSAEHLTTNQYTVSYWEKFGIQGVFLSNEITKEEVLSIKKNTSLMCIAQVFGYIPMYVSKRKAIQNYLNHFQLKTDSKRFSLLKEGKEYPILERKIGTEIYSSFLLNAIEEYLEYQHHNMEYAFINGFLIPATKLSKVIRCFKTVNADNIEKKKEELNHLFKNMDKGFLYQETVYQVKKNEK